jgi:hypothetical protein
MKETNGGLESLALVLIIAPDPITTIIGLGILAYARCVPKSSPSNIPRRIQNKFSDMYSYKVHMTNGKRLTYQLNVKREGQLPASQVNANKLYSDSVAWNKYRQSVIRDARAKKSVLTGQQRPGVLNRPNVMNHTRLVEP